VQRGGRVSVGRADINLLPRGGGRRYTSPEEESGSPSGRLFEKGRKSVSILRRKEDDQNRHLHSSKKTFCGSCMGEKKDSPLLTRKGGPILSTEYQTDKLPLRRGGLSSCSLIHYPLILHAGNGGRIPAPRNKRMKILYSMH